MSNESTIPTPATPDVCTVAVLIDGTELPGTLHILSVSVTRELNRIPSAVLHFKDGEAAKGTFEASNATHFVPGKKIEVQLGYRSQNSTVFRGIIIRHSIRVRKGSGLLVVECRHEAVRMTSGLNSRYFIDRKDSDIMEELLDLYGLQKKVQSTAPDLKEVVQYESSDWDFLVCRAEANGRVVIAGDDKVVIGPPDTESEPVVKVSYGSTILELDAEIDARWQSSGIRTMSWSPADQDLAETDAAEPATMDNGNILPSELSVVTDEQVHTLRHGGRLAQPELQAWADARLLRERLARIRGRVRFQGFAEVTPGRVIEVTGIGERFEGRLYVSGVRQSVSGGNWETDVQFGIDPRLFAETYNLRPLPASGLLPGVGGLQIGIVTLLEGDPEGEERIKVRLPLISNSEEGIWTRLATLDAGKERGTFFRPEIGDEVVVGFLGDDPRHPVVLGMCHSSSMPSPEAAADDNHLKGYMSREKMKLTFDDKKKIIHIETPGGNKLSLTEEKKGILIEDQNGNRISLDDSGITIESVKDLMLKATKDIKAEGMNIELKAQTGFKAEGSASAEVSGANTTIKGSAATVISGGVVQIN
ncbi:MAG: type VI secretion system tip protein VgrG [Chlorobium sp.]|uniref:type VI secretion system tip protein VgrG n=1 Tax=Chlorobium sp. TaxID=1095 RepID=UPI002F3F8EC9